MRVENISRPWNNSSHDMFAFFDEGKQGHMVRYTRGVKYVVGKVNPLTPIPR